MKKAIQRILQNLLGFDRYLFWFSRFKIATLKWDSREGDFFHFLSLFPSDANVLDIGANIGIMTVLLGKKCSEGEVHAFEPIPENFAALKRISDHYKLGNIHLHHIALGESAGELEMVMPELKSVRMQGLSHVVHESITDFNEGKKYTVPVKTLDDIAPTLHSPIHAIKIDVENFEQFVFKGGMQLLESDRPIVYAELWDNENRKVCFKIFEDLEYEIQVLINGKAVTFDPLQHKKQNFFFMP